MAKRGTLDHPKTLLLADTLHVEPPHALGLLEAFWHWVGKYAPTGEITGTDERLIAMGMRTRKTPEALFAALIECGFIDERDGRRAVHDWHEHADNSVKKWLGRKGRQIVDLSTTCPGLVPQMSGQVQTLATLPEARSQRSMPEVSHSPHTTVTPGVEGCMEVVTDKGLKIAELSGDPHAYFERTFPGEIHDDTWRVFGECVCTPELLDAFGKNYPLWLKTAKFRDGFAGVANRFLRSGAWKRVPPPEMIDRGGQKAAPVVERPLAHGPSLIAKQNAEYEARQRESIERARAAGGGGVQ